MYFGGAGYNTKFQETKGVDFGFEFNHLLENWVRWIFETAIINKKNIHIWRRISEKKTLIDRKEDNKRFNALDRIETLPFVMIEPTKQNKKTKLNRCSSSNHKQGIFSTNLHDLIIVDWMSIESITENNRFDLQWRPTLTQKSVPLEY